MDQYFSQTIGTPVITESGQKVGRIYNIVLNTDTGKVAGFIVSPGGGKVLAPIDVLSWHKAIDVHDVDVILEMDEIRQVYDSLRKNIPVIMNRVYTKKGIYLGKVIDFAISDKLFVLTKIVVAKTILGIITYSHRIIAHQDILEIKKDAIIVKDLLLAVPIKAAKLSVDAAPLTQ
jgi:sporulation protein YlmC with PRC-barrel domain